MKRLIVIIITAVIAGKIVATAIVKFAENSNFTSKALVHKLFLDKSTEDKMKISDVPSNLRIAKPVRNIHRQFPPYLNRLRATVAPVVVAKAAKPDEKAIEEKAKEDKKLEDERRKKRRKALEEKTNAVADQPKAASPAPYYFQGPAANPYPISYLYGAPVAQANPQPNNVPAVQPIVPKPIVPGTVSTQSNANVSSWTKILVENPTAPLMASFENQYKTNQINESQYYSVLDAMIASSNSESRNYAVQAAALYQNINSFKILADESQTESNLTIKSQANADVSAYAAAADVSILQQASTSGDANEKLVAAHLLGSPTVAQN